MARSLFVALPVVTLLLFTLPASKADASFFRVYAQGHGTFLEGGGGQFFDDHDGPLLGYGAELGAKVLFLHAFMDVNILGSVEGQNLYWNQIGLGTELGLPIPIDALQVYGRAHVTYVSATFARPDDEGSLRTGGFGARLGGGAQYRLFPTAWLGAAVHFGAHTFGESRDGGGANTMGQLYLRFQFGL